MKTLRFKCVTYAEQGVHMALVEMPDGKWMVGLDPEKHVIEESEKAAIVVKGLKAAYHLADLYVVSGCDWSKALLDLQ